MKQAFFIYILVVSVIAVSCKSDSKNPIRDYIISEKDIIPEGLAFDTATQTIYVSSTYKKKIISISQEGNVKDFISEAQDDIKSVVGMEVDGKRNCLWAVSSEANEVLPLKNPSEAQWRSSVYQFNLSNGKLIQKYQLQKDSAFLNDITVGDDGTVFVTESVGNAVYCIEPGSDSLRLFIELNPFHFINGICFTDKPGYLFVSSTEGIISIDLFAKSFSLVPSVPGIDHRDIDGLSFTGGYFIGHQSTKVSRFYLSADRDSIRHSDTLNSGKEFDGSTTGEIGNGYYYFIVNSQIQSGVDYEKQTIKPLDSLANIIIRKIKL